MPGDHEINSRQESRYDFTARALLERSNGEAIPGSTVNISGGGLLVIVNADTGLVVGETVRCGVELYAGKPLQSWGMGRIVRVQNSLVAIDFRSAEGEGCPSAA